MSISKQELLAMPAQWGNALLSISEAYERDGIVIARSLAKEIIDEKYGFSIGPVLFKPTLSSGEQTFRHTPEGALSYFVGHDPEFPRDTGFATRRWRDVTSNTSSYFINGKMALWMGRFKLTDKQDQIMELDKSFGFIRDGNGSLKIVLHHSSLPYQDHKA